MKRIFYIGISSVILFTIGSCKKDDSPIPGRTSNNTGWSIPENQVFGGGPGKDGIPAIDNPIFISPSAASFINDDQLVVGFKFGNIARAYPHLILDWHEIVNDKIGELNFSIVYCPLTGSATVWNREIDGTVTTFGVSGLLYNSNIIPYDRNTDSNWSQMELECVQGELKGIEPEGFNVVETTWGTWKKMYPDTEILSTETGFSRSYGVYPYGDYRTGSSLIFPISAPDSRLHSKERVLGVVIDDLAKAYKIEDFTGDLKVIEDILAGEPIVLAGSANQNFAVAFSKKLEGQERSFSPVTGNRDIILEDDKGNQFDVFGYAVSGPDAGKQLGRVESFIGYWFAWGTFRDGLALYNE